MSQINRDNFPVTPADNQQSASDGKLVQGTLPRADYAVDPVQVISNNEINQLLKSGLFQAALTSSKQNLSVLTESYGSGHRFSLYALSNLMEVAVKVNDSTPINSSQVALLAERAINSKHDYGHLRLHALTRLSEFSSHFGYRRTELRETAHEALECLHSCYPFSVATDDLRQQYALSQLTSATGITFWQIKTESPDFRALDYIAACGRDRLARFAPDQSEFYYSLYELRRNWVEPALERLEQLLESSEKSSSIRLAALEASIQGSLRAGRPERAREHLSTLENELTAVESPSQIRGMVERCQKYRLRLDPDRGQMQTEN